MARLWLLVLLGIAVLLSSQTVSAATVSGKIYDLSLDLVSEAVVEINTAPKQVFVAKNGSYSFSVPSGNYVLTAKQIEQELVASENITVAGEGSYNLDLLLFPSFEEEELLLNETELDLGTPFDEPVVWPYYAAGGVILLVAIAYYFARKRKQSAKPAIVKEEPKAAEAELPDKIVAFIRKEGGRTTQKDIRKSFPFSEAKISLAVAELEHKGIVEKIKKGRGNIVILK
jgi:uncharacterized membrane protein